LLICFNALPPHVGTWAHWRHLANMIELMLFSVHQASFSPPESTTETEYQSVQPFLHSSRQKVPILSPKIAHSHWGIWNPHLTLDSFGPSPQPKRRLSRFSHFCTDNRRMSLYFTMGCPFPLSKLPIPMGDLDPQLMHGSLGPPVPQPKPHLDQFNRFCRAH